MRQKKYISFISAMHTIWYLLARLEFWLSQFDGYKNAVIEVLKEKIELQNG